MLSEIQLCIDLLEFPTEDDEDWDSCKLSEFDDKKWQEWNAPMPLDKDDTSPLYNICAGKYGLDQANLTLVHARQH